jgi:hypothetical protein
MADYSTWIMALRIHVSFGIAWPDDLVRLILVEMGFSV